MARPDLRASWPLALWTLLGPLVAFFSIRWIVAEPFVIPSGSMIPTLHIHDHILVNKLAYGIHIPFSSKWLIQWGRPQRNDIIVFRFPNNPEVFYVKRAVAVAGDRISLRRGELWINGQAVPIQPRPAPAGDTDAADFEYFLEAGHVVRYLEREGARAAEQVVPPGHVFAMGDNRDQSNDSRFWGFVPEKNLVGRAWLIWMGCDSTLASAQFLCDPLTLRWDRVLIRPD